MKKILLVILVTVTIFMIYLLNMDRKVYYVALGDDITTTNLDQSKGYSNYIKEYLDYYDQLEKYIYQFSKESYRITDIISDINNNKKVTIEDTEKTIKNALIKADLLTLSIGLNDLSSRINRQNINFINDYESLYNAVDQISEDLEELLILLRQYCKENIFLIGIYYPYHDQNLDLNAVFSYFNNKFKELSAMYDIEYIDIYDIFIENPGYLSETSIYPSEEGLEAISRQIIVTINNTIIKNGWFCKKSLL